MYAHCMTMYGINIVLAKYETNQPITDPRVQFRTGDVVDNNGGLNGVYTGTAANDSTDGTIEKNYKIPVVEKINRKTDELIRAGYSHNGVHFSITLEKQINAIVLFMQRLVGQDMTGQMFRADGEDYTFINNDDFDLWFANGANVVQTRIREGAELKNDVTSAENSEVGMAPIIGANNARK